MTIKLESTGERVIEDAYQNSLGGYVIYLMHKASYQFVRKICAGRNVLDLGCGSGYGAASLADTALHVTAVDVSAEAAAYAADRYKAPNLIFQAIAADATLPFVDESFDVVLSFQVIEHVSDEAHYFREARRVLKRGGMMVVITPDRRLRLLPYQKPWNRWHLREYSMASLRKVVEPHLQVETAYFMGAADNVARVETRRYFWAKWGLLPITLPFVPEVLRRFALDAIHRLLALRKSDGVAKTASPPNYGFNESAMLIGPSVPNSLNLILVVRRD